MEKSRDGQMLKRVILLRTCAEMGMPVGAIKEISRPMREMSIEQKEAYAARVLKELEDSENGTSTMTTDIS